MKETRANVRNRTSELVYIALFACLIALCAWITVPAAVPFTLQTFSIFCAVGMLGGRRGTIAVLVYMLLGVIGLPVFSGFRGGFGVLLGTTGGYIVGFLFTTLTYWLVTKLCGQKLGMLLGMSLGLVACYAFGTVWFMAVYTRTTGTIGLGTALVWCVFPFILPDAIKIALAIALTKLLSPHIKSFSK
ncbi:MAG: biotin transporter BioY [Clostridiaceae bacterium]|nr:biotin transporter BioY [Clostridiaceae bacterium]